MYKVSPEVKKKAEIAQLQQSLNWLLAFDSELKDFTKAVKKFDPVKKR